MFDKVKFIIHRTGGRSQFSHLAEVLEKPEQKLRADTGELGGMRGRIRNISVYEFPWGVSIEGSLCKFAHGSNLIDLSFEEARNALVELGELTKLDVREATVTRLEFGCNLVMKSSVARYFPLLGSMPRRLRDPFGASSLYYRREGKKQLDTLKFYDKIAEAKKENISIPPSLAEVNLLRVELSLNGNLSRQLNREVLGKTLGDPSFYNDMIDLLINKYCLINKQDAMIIKNLTEFKTPKAAANGFLASVLLQDKNPQEAIENYIRSLRDANVFADRNDYTRTKKRLLELLKAAEISERNPLRDELDAAVLELSNRKCPSPLL